jgi:hypothetical protein
MKLRLSLLHTLASVLVLTAVARRCCRGPGPALWRAPDHTRLVLDMSGAGASTASRAQANPRRLVIDVADTGLRRPHGGLALDNTPITACAAASAMAMICAWCWTCAPPSARAASRSRPRSAPQTAWLSTSTTSATPTVAPGRRESAPPAMAAATSSSPSMPATVARIPARWAPAGCARKTWCWRSPGTAPAV